MDVRNLIDLLFLLVPMLALGWAGGMPGAMLGLAAGVLIGIATGALPSYILVAYLLLLSVFLWRRREEKHEE